MNSLLGELGLLVALLALCEAQFDTSSCTDLSPVVGSGTVSGAMPPYLLASSPTFYTVGDNPIDVQVFLIDQGASSYSSVIIQAQRVDTSVPVGTFELTDPTLRPLECGGDQGVATIASIDSNPKNLPLRLRWRPPVIALGDVRFVWSIIETQGGNIYLRREGFQRIEGPAASTLSISCPANIRTIDQRVIYPAPSCGRGAVAVGQVTCTPSSGSIFQVGVTEVRCICTHVGDTASCVFDVLRTIDTGGPCNNPITGNPCSRGLDCRTAPQTLAGYTCHSGEGVPCQPLNLPPLSS